MPARKRRHFFYGAWRQPRPGRLPPAECASSPRIAAPRRAYAPSRPPPGLTTASLQSLKRRTPLLCAAKLKPCAMGPASSASYAWAWAMGCISRSLRLEPRHRDRAGRVAQPPRVRRVLRPGLAASPPGQAAFEHRSAKSPGRVSSRGFAVSERELGLVDRRVGQHSRPL